MDAKDRDYRVWQKMFKTLVHMLQIQRTEIESLAEDRKLLEHHVCVQRDRWISEVTLLKDHISMIERDAEMDKMLLDAKSALLIAMKKKEASMYKHKSECSESDVADMGRVIEYLTLNQLEQKGKHGRNEGNAQDESHSKNLRGEIRRLKHTIDKMNSQNKSEVSALLNERNFLWNQLKKMESDYSDRLKTKCIELEKANQNTQELQLSLEKWQLSARQKDETIGRLKADQEKLQKDMDNHNEEIYKLSKELELLRSSRTSSLTPLLRCSRAESTSGGLKTDEKIGRLKADGEKLQKDMDSHNEEISKPSKELELLKSSKNSSLTPLVRCSRAKLPLNRLKTDETIGRLKADGENLQKDTDNHNEGISKLSKELELLVTPLVRCSRSESTSGGLKIESPDKSKKRPHSRVLSKLQGSNFTEEDGKIHTKRRNRLEQKRLNDLVFIRYNQILHHRYQLRDSIDPISLKDIDESNEWLTERMDNLDLGDDEGGAADLVFDGEDLDWAVVSEAMGVDEPRARTRGARTSSTSTSAAARRRRATQLEEEIVYEDDDDEEEEEEYVGDDTDEENMDDYEATYDNDSP